MKIGPNTTVGKAIGAARVGAGMSQTDLADILGISIWSLSRVEHGNRAFDTEWLAVMPASLSGPIREVLTREINGDLEPAS